MHRTFRRSTRIGPLAFGVRAPLLCEDLHLQQQPMGRVRGAGLDLPRVLLLPSAPWSRHAGHSDGAACRHASRLAESCRFDEEAMPLTRSWCLFELLQTVLLQALIGK